MKTPPDCLPCILRQAIKAMRLCGIEETKIASTLKKLLDVEKNFDTSLTPPDMAMLVHGTVRKMCVIDDPYRRVKDKSVAEMLLRENAVRNRILTSKNPFKTAARFAVVGNSLDFAVFDWDCINLDAAISSAETKPLDESALDRLETAVASANVILILGDNAGESVMDKLLIEQMGDKKIYYAVRGGSAINDTTMREAKMSGLDKVATLVSNGVEAPGTLLNRAPDEFIELFENADLVISKGQGNFESLNDAPRKIFFLLQIKCPVVTRDLRGKVGDWIVFEGGNPR